MRRGSYKIQDGYSGSGGGKEASEYVWCESAARPPDSSYSTCLLALLLFLFLCVVIMLAAWPWKAGKPTTDAETESPIREGLSAGKMTTVPKSLPSAPKENPTVNDTLKSTSVTATERSDSIYPTLFSAETETSTSPSSPAVDVLPVKDKNDSEIFVTTVKNDTHEALVEEKIETSISSKETESPIREGLSAGKMTTVSTSLSPAPEENSTVSDTLKSTSITATERSDSIHPTSFSTETGTNESPSYPAVDVLPVKDKNDSEIFVTTVKNDTHEALLDEKEEPSISSEEKEFEFERGNDCWTSACKTQASQMLALMNHSTDACHDLYSFACGGMRGEAGKWISEEVKELKPMQRVLEMLHKHNPSMSSTKKKFQAFIDKCIHIHESLGDRIEQAKSIIKDVGPFLLSKSDNGSISDLLTNLLLHNFPTIFDILLEPENTNQLILAMSLPELMSPLGQSSEDDATLNGWKSITCLKKATEKPRDGSKEVDLNARYTAYIQCNSNISKYVEEVEEVLRALNLFEEGDKKSEDAFIDETVFFLKKELLKEIQGNLPSQTDRNVNMTKRPSNLLFLSELQTKFSLVEWEALVSKLIGDSGTDALEYVQVNLYYESYFEHIFRVLELMSVRKLYNGLLAMFAHEVYYGLVVKRNSCFRGKYCFDVASELMPEAVSSLFLSSFHKDQLEEFKIEINYLFTQLKTQMESEVEKVTWLKDKSREKILKKISEMKLIDDGGCPYFLDDKYLDKQFEDYPLNSTYLEDAVSLMRRIRRKTYGAFSEKPLKAIWSLFVPPYSTKPKAFYELNAIVVPYGIMLQPFSTLNSARYLQMATVGSQIAKVMWQHFDGTGLMFSYKGSRIDNLAADVVSSMEAVTVCFEEQYQDQKFVIDEGITVKYQLPESLTVNSRLADAGGIYLAFNTMMKNNSGAPLPWLSDLMNKKQLYFLTIAQSMCTKSSVYEYAVSLFEEEDLPPFLRVEDIARNSKAFNEAFSCYAKKITKPVCEPFTLVNETKAKPFHISV